MKQFGGVFEPRYENVYDFCALEYLKTKSNVIYKLNQFFKNINKISTSDLKIIILSID